MLVLVPAIYMVLAAFKMPPVMVVVPMAYTLPTAALKAMVPLPALTVKARLNASPFSVLLKLMLLLAVVWKVLPEEAPKVTAPV